MSSSFGDIFMNKRHEFMKVDFLIFICGDGKERSLEESERV